MKTRGEGAPSPGCHKEVERVLHVRRGSGSISGAGRKSEMKALHEAGERS